MSYNQKLKLCTNLEAMDIAFKHKYENYYVTLPDYKVLKEYSGFGGLKGILFGNGSIEDWKKQNASEQDLGLYNYYQRVYELIHRYNNKQRADSIIDSLKNSVLSAFYTPKVIPDTFFKVLKDYNPECNTIYEPSAGSGVFLQSFADTFTDPLEMTCYEKDEMSSLVLKAISSYKQWCGTVNIYNFPFEESKNDRLCDVIASNIPFGNFPVYDPAFNDNNLTGKIHNYFFAKGIDKIKEGGILAYLTTNAFLDSASNKTARQYLFSKCDFVSLTVMPDILMYDTSNTMAPTHFLVVLKNTAKTALSTEELLLVESSLVQTEFKGVYPLNKYIQKYSDSITIGNVKIGKNQYGKLSREVIFDKPINELEGFFRDILNKDFLTRYYTSKELENERFEDVANLEQKDDDVLFDPDWPDDVEETSTPLQALSIIPKDNILSKIPYKQGMLSEVITNDKDLFTKNTSIMNIESEIGNECKVSKVILKGKEEDLIKHYLKIRDIFIELTQNDK